MNQQDSCQRFIFSGLDIRGEVVRLNGSFAEILANKEYPQAVRNLLGEFLAASVLLSTTIKFDGRLVLQARSEGQIPLIMAECTNELHLRGIARYEEEPTSDNFNELLHSGTLAITVEPPNGEPYQGIVPLEQDSLAACLEEYFTRSEQLEGHFFLVADEHQCAGLLLQQLPKVSQRSNLRTRLNTILPSQGSASWKTVPEIYTNDAKDANYTKSAHFVLKLTKTDREL